eukprot:Rmarinus@m.10241
MLPWRLRGLPCFRFYLVMRNIIGPRHAELALVQGSMLTTQQALQVGLVDTIVSPESASGHCVAKVRNILDSDDHARAETKKMIREETVEWLRTRWDEQLEKSLQMFLSRRSQLEQLVKVIGKK